MQNTGRPSKRTPASRKRLIEAAGSGYSSLEAICGHLLVADISGFIDRITALIPDPGARKLANQQSDIFEEHICDRFAKAMIRALETHPPKSEQACECEGHS